MSERNDYDKAETLRSGISLGCGFPSMTVAHFFAKLFTQNPIPVAANEPIFLKTMYFPSEMTGKKSKLMIAKMKLPFSTCLIRRRASRQEEHVFE